MKRRLGIFTKKRSSNSFKRFETMLQEEKQDVNRKEYIKNKNK